MKLKDVFFLCKESISPNIRYIKELEDKIYEVHEVKKNNVIKYTLTVMNNKVNILEEEEKRI